MTTEPIRAAFAKVYPKDDALLSLAENNRDYWLDAMVARARWAAFQAGTAAGISQPTVTSTPEANIEVGTGEFIPHSLAGFVGCFISRHNRKPTEQEIWDHAIRSWRDLNARSETLTDSEIMSLAYDCNALPEVITDHTLLIFARALHKGNLK